jgi:hypothetical protein
MTRSIRSSSRALHAARVVERHAPQAHDLTRHPEVLGRGRVVHALGDAPEVQLWVRLDGRRNGHGRKMCK